MLSADELVEMIAKGWNIHVARRADHRLVRFSDGSGTIKREDTLPLADYEVVFERAMSLLARGHRSRFHVSVHMDFYGRVHVEVRSGLFGLQTSILRISPRHIAMLERLIDDVALADTAA
ncbi:MAG: hypothetical protein KDK08_12850 [Rhizobiaceae bacterium]|nr:hypothetical protein [Rhizobiaceae bacterium]